MTGSGRKTLMRSLGEFVGHIWQGVRADPAAPQRTEVRRESREAAAETPAATVTLRRTIIEEVEVTPKDHTP